MNARMAELNAKTEAQLRDELRDVRRALFGHRVSLANHASENFAGTTKLRRDIARINTVLRARLAGKVPASGATPPAKAPPATPEATDA